MKCVLDPGSLRFGILMQFLDASNPSTTGVLLEHLLYFVREIVSTVRAYDALQKLLCVYGLWLRVATHMYMGQSGNPVASQAHSQL